MCPPLYGKDFCQCWNCSTQLSLSNERWLLECEDAPRFLIFHLAFQMIYTFSFAVLSNQRLHFFVHSNGTRSLLNFMTSMTCGGHTFFLFDQPDSSLFSKYSLTCPSSICIDTFCLWLCLSFYRGQMRSRSRWVRDH
jgi:hypothetical protein